ncbi:hypothetical protein MSAN_00538100 [Mycena sanguinolenta]|uniref:DUF6533 domain-containing protein n=1 Tax=Mycena sanguinolenta TaxID=230812 RepID=A0A8H6ZAE2_9AGAR|nr:hypothetical protein MSAN_00538100 [Mycena sanguinolenta]
MDSLAVTAQDLRLDSYTAAACLTLLTYDTFLNLALEHRYIWESKWGLIKCLYLWSRYGTFLEISLDLLTEQNENLDPATCSTLAEFIAIYSGLVMVRTYALYGRSKKVLVFFVLMWLSIGAIGTWAVVNVKESESTQDINHMMLHFSLSNVVIVLLTLWKALHTFHRPAESSLKPSRLPTNFYREGILFYLVMLLCLILVVVLQSDAPEALKSIGHAPLRVIHLILACQLVVHIRVVASEDETNSAAIITPIVFANFTREKGRELNSIV